MQVIWPMKCPECEKPAVDFGALDSGEPQMQVCADGHRWEAKLPVSLPPTFEALVRESYEELLRVTAAAASIEREAGDLRERAAALGYRIHVLLRTAADA